MEQIQISEKWCKEGEALIEEKGTQEEAYRLIKLVENDVDGDLKLIDLDLYARVKAYCFSKIFDFSNREEKELSARDFIKYIKSNLPKDLQIDTHLVEDEIKIADLARRIKNWETRDLDFEVTDAEARSMLEMEGSQNLPFIVEPAL